MSFNASRKIKEESAGKANNFCSWLKLKLPKSDYLKRLKNLQGFQNLKGF